jgi:hypothetical protein
MHRALFVLTSEEKLLPLCGTSQAKKKIERTSEGLFGWQTVSHHAPRKLFIQIFITLYQARHWLPPPGTRAITFDKTRTSLLAGGLQRKNFTLCINGGADEDMKRAMSSDGRTREGFSHFSALIRAVPQLLVSECMSNTHMDLS